MGIYSTEMVKLMVGGKLLDESVRWAHFFQSKISIRFVFETVETVERKKASLINLAVWLKVSVYIISHVSFPSSQTIGYKVAVMEGWIFSFGAI